MIEPFPVRYRRAVADGDLQHTLLEFQRNWRRTRDEATASIDFESDRRRLAALKDDVIRNLPEHLDTFTESCSRTGTIVHRARTPDDALRVVLQIARKSGVSRVVKSKSMVTEELDLNDGLQEAGLRVVETDLGEWIVQLAGERPSHIIGPALHKNRRQIGELFSRVTGKPVSLENIAEQVGVAREQLRDEFLHAEMGISGANAIVAETGTVAVVTNEGNAELVTSLPGVHVVVVGIEKLLPRLEDLSLQLGLLARSATGQAATSYVTLVSGPSTSESELHVILVDNGRTAMRESALFADALRCIRCGACSSVCPSYAVVGGHVFGYIYSGAIGLVNTPFHHGLEHDVGPQSLCVSCNACQTVCPVDIPLPRQILDTRAEVVKTVGMPVVQRIALHAWSRPRVSRAALRAAGLLQTPLRRGEFLHPPRGFPSSKWRAPRAIARTPFRDRWSDLDRSKVTPLFDMPLHGARIAFFVQCLTDWLYPSVGESVVEVLRRLGATVIFPTSQHCCGLPALDSGAPRLARHMARQTIETLEECDADYIVSGGTSCVIAIAHEYPHLFRDEPSWRARAERVGHKMKDFTSLLSEAVRLPAGALDPTGPATYHYFCQSYNVLGFRDEPMSLLSEVCGVALAPLPEANVCCGFGGTVSVKRPDMCARILRRKLDNVRATGAGILITDNPGCMMHLRGGAVTAGMQLTVRHTAEVVAERLRLI